MKGYANENKETNTNKYENSEVTITNLSESMIEDRIVEFDYLNDPQESFEDGEKAVKIIHLSDSLLKW